MCGDMEIKFPFTLQSSSNSCRTAGLSANLPCSSTNETIITLPSSESYRVASIVGFNYGIFIDVLLSTSSTSCPWRIVKLLEASKSNGDDFVNEVATIGKIHHVNVVRLLGFCSEGTSKALVYEFMSNNSLEKFIFMGESKKRHKFFSTKKLQEIAIGIAQGINYLHQGCNQRILHFDIKPHNILLDYDFNPKISDFGLAKLCSRDQSIVTISTARGTMGYIAPEVYSRIFGPVSHKSDVYSYGMLLLEMIERRKNVDPTIENLSEIYFPEWIYNKLVHSNSLGLAIEIEGNEEILKRLAIIALWCIQWNPSERPSMNKVVQMLTTNFQSLEMPPTPFVPSSDQHGNVYV
ncbi:hypothetical protein KFK09_011655 [Dendrobium nobile]|uniref:Protein kinase domain-containing protein n=1 Tax=Dendrobium nobile TaxID=94219 RepID=A0A8T3BFM7_DENNO|nr:hypothetical protein KFK09_011655 [Dendrobium nobile]